MVLVAVAVGGGWLAHVTRDWCSIERHELGSFQWCGRCWTELSRSFDLCKPAKQAPATQHEQSVTL